MAKLPDFTGLGSLPAPQPSRSVVPATLRPFEPHPAGQGLEALASGESNLASDIFQAQDRMDTLRAEDAWTQLRSKQMDLTYGQNGFMQLKGGDAVNAPLLKTYGDQLNQATGQIGGTLDNENQRRMFAQRAAISSLQMKEGILKHVDDQKNVYAGDQLNSIIDTERQNAALNWADPNAPTLPMQRINAAIDQFGRDYGKPAEWVADLKEKAKTGVYSDIIKQAMLVDPDRAEQMLMQHLDEVKATERAQLSAMIQSHQYTRMMRDTMQQQREDMKNARILRQAQTQNESDMLAATITGNPPDAATLADALHKQQISPEAYFTILRGQNEKVKENPEVVLDLWKRIGQNQDITKDAYAAAQLGDVSLDHAAEMVRAVNSRNKEGTNDVERGYHDALKQGLGLDSMGRPIVDLTGEQGQAHAALITKALAEWTDRVVAKHGDPRAVYQDILSRYQPIIDTPRGLPRPRLGVVNSIEDVSSVYQKTKDAFGNGKLTADQYGTEIHLLDQYRQIFTSQEQRRQSQQQQQSQGGKKAKLRGITTE